MASCYEMCGSPFPANFRLPAPQLAPWQQQVHFSRDASQNSPFSEDFSISGFCQPNLALQANHQFEITARNGSTLPSSTKHSQESQFVARDPCHKRHPIQLLDADRWLYKEQKPVVHVPQYLHIPPPKLQAFSHTQLVKQDVSPARQRQCVFLEHLLEHAACSQEDRVITDDASTMVSNSSMSPSISDTDVWVQNLLGEDDALQSTLSSSTSSLHQGVALQSYHPCPLEAHSSPAKASLKDVTTLMIRNIPTSVTQAQLAEEIDNSGFACRYDFLYAPNCFSGNEVPQSLGYAFVNFVSSAVATEFLSTFGKSKHFGSIVNLSPARLQGLEANVARWRGSRLRRIKNPSLQPLVLAPSAEDVATILQLPTGRQGEASV